MEPSPLYRVFVREYPRLCALAAGILRDRSLAQDAVQESWLRLQKLGRLDTGGEEKLRHLVVLTVRHTACNLRRKQAPTPVEDTLLLQLQDQDPLPGERVEQRERLRALLAALDQLEETDRTILQLQYGQALNSRQIARLVGLKPAAVRQRARRARQVLRARLEKEGLQYD